MMAPLGLCKGSLLVNAISRPKKRVVVCILFGNMETLVLLSLRSKITQTAKFSSVDDMLDGPTPTT